MVTFVKSSFGRKVIFFNKSFNLSRNLRKWIAYGHYSLHPELQKEQIPLGSMLGGGEGAPKTRIEEIIRNFAIKKALFYVNLNKIFTCIRELASLCINLSLKTVQLSPLIFGKFCEKLIFYFNQLRADAVKKFTFS